MFILALVALAFLSTPLFAAVGVHHHGKVALLPLVLFIGFLTLLPGVAAGSVVLESVAWIPSLGIDAAFRADGLSLTFALLITGIGTAVFLYASAYLKGEPRLGRFYATLILFMASMLGAVLADNLILLIVFWEMTSLTSFLLIGYSPEKSQARRAAQQGLLITVGGGLSLLAGTILLGYVAGSFSISVVLGQGAAIADHPLAPVIIVLVAIGAFAKSAQAPLHSWLTNAMVAPTPVSAYLHSATMVKLGLYLLARLDPLFSDTALWIGLLTGAGLLTMLVGAVLAMRETDLKRLLAYSTIVSLGTLVLLVGTPGELAAIAMMAFLVGHALYKACLFMVAGIIDHETGTRDASKLGGLRRAMPLTAAAALLGALSMAGLPPFVGFAAKELVYEAGLGSGSILPVLAVTLFANVVMVVIAAIVGWRCFSGEPTKTPTAPHDPGMAMLAGPLVLGGLGVAFGLFPWLVGGYFVVPGASAVVGAPVEYSLTLWHGLTPMLGLSVVTVIAGIFIFTRWSVVRSRLQQVHQFDDVGPDRLYDRLMTGLQTFSTWQTRAIQSGSLRSYVARTVSIFALAGILTLLLRRGLEMPSFASVWVPEVAIAVLMIAASMAVIRARNFVSGIVAAGMVGFAVALLFLFQGAPDLAFTQFSVEALAIVIMLAIVGRMPFRDPDSRVRDERLRDGAVAALVGMMASLVLLSVIAQPFDARLSEWFANASVPEAHGRNLVNVILVDFRALDTLGEITVLGLAAVAAAAVLAGLRRNREEKNS